MLPLYLLLLLSSSTAQEDPLSEPTVTPDTIAALLSPSNSSSTNGNSTLVEEDYGRNVTVAPADYEDGEYGSSNSSEALEDMVEYHLRRYLSHDHSACADFFRFACNYDIIREFDPAELPLGYRNPPTENDSIVDKSEDFYRRVLDDSPPFATTIVDVRRVLVTVSGLELQ